MNRQLREHINQARLGENDATREVKSPESDAESGREGKVDGSESEGEFDLGGSCYAGKIKVDKPVVIKKLLLPHASAALPEGSLRQSSCNGIGSNNSKQDNLSNAEKLNHGLRKYFDFTPRSARTDADENVGDHYLTPEPTPRKFTTRQARIIELAHEHGFSSLAFIRLTKMYINRTIKSTRPVKAQPTKLEYELSRALEDVLRNKSNCFKEDCILELLNNGENKSFATSIKKTPQKTRPPPPPPPCHQDKAHMQPALIIPSSHQRINFLVTLFPTRYGAKASGAPSGSTLPRAPSAHKRPPGRARTKAMLFNEIVSYLDAPDIIALSSTCRGLWRFCFCEKVVTMSWGRFAWTRFGNRKVASKSDYVHLWQNYRNSCIMLYGPTTHAHFQTFLHDRVAGKFQVIAVDSLVPSSIDALDRSDAVAQAIFCAAKACSPSIVHIRDSHLLETQPEEQNASDGHRSLCVDDINRLCRLVKHDLSKDPIVVLCHSENPWRIEKHVLDQFRLIEGLTETERSNDRGESLAGSFRLEVEKLEKALGDIAPNLSVQETTQLIQEASRLVERYSGDDFTQDVLDIAAGNMLERLRESHYFRLIHGKYHVCTFQNAGAKRVEHLGELPVTEIHYGPYFAHDFLHALAKLSHHQSRHCPALNVEPRRYWNAMGQWKAHLKANIT